MSQQTINVGTTANDGTGDPLRVAGQKINANFTEVYTLAQNAFNQANTATYPDQAAFDTANSAYAQANTGTTLAQNAFNKANTANTSAQSGFDKANTANTTAQSGFDQANTGNTLAQAGFGQANTAANTAQSGFDQANTANTTAQAGFDKANTANTTAQTGFDAANTAQYFRYTTIISSASHNASNTDNILLCDPNTVGANIVLNLSTDVSDGKIFTIKNINPGSYSVNVAASSIEDPVSKSIVTEVVMANTGEVYTWVAHSGVYRHIG